MFVDVLVSVVYQLCIQLMSVQQFARFGQSRFLYIKGEDVFAPFGQKDCVVTVAHGCVECGVVFCQYFGYELVRHVEGFYHHKQLYHNIIPSTKQSYCGMTLEINLWVLTLVSQSMVLLWAFSHIHNIHLLSENFNALLVDGEYEFSFTDFFGEHAPKTSELEKEIAEFGKYEQEVFERYFKTHSAGLATMFDHEIIRKESLYDYQLNHIKDIIEQNRNGEVAMSRSGDQGGGNVEDKASDYERSFAKNLKDTSLLRDTRERLIDIAYEKIV